MSEKKTPLALLSASRQPASANRTRFARSAYRAVAYELADVPLQEQTLWSRSGRSEVTVGFRLSIQVPLTAPLEATIVRGNIAISRDGTSIAYVAADSRHRRLWIRHVDRLEPEPLARRGPPFGVT